MMYEEIRHTEIYPLTRTEEAEAVTELRALLTRSCRSLPATPQASPQASPHVPPPVSPHPNGGGRRGPEADGSSVCGVAAPGLGFRV